MAYQFKEIQPGTYLVEDHICYKDANGNWIERPEIKKMSLKKAFLNYIKTL
jgi:hypothetical protein